MDEPPELTPDIAPPERRAREPFEFGLQHVFLGLLCLLLLLLCFLVWRVSMVVWRTEQAVRDLSADLRQVTGTAARVAEDIDRARVRLEQIEKQAAEALSPDEVEALLAAAADLRRPAATTPAASEVEREIRWLLARVRDSGLDFETDGRHCSALRLYLQLYSKYRAYRTSLGSGEEFIERLATQTIGGHPYLIRRGEARAPLADWLRAELARRPTPAPSPSAAPAEPVP